MTNIKLTGTLLTIAVACTGLGDFGSQLLLFRASVIADIVCAAALIISMIWSA